MKRLHVSVGTTDMEKSVAFYSTLFGTPPTMERDGYAKWMLDDPRVNFVVDRKATGAGVDHLGIQVEDEHELADVTARLNDAGEDLVQQEATECCFHISDKTWANDPQGVAWETFLTHGEVTTYGVTREEAGALLEAEGQKVEKTDACCD
jgi:catechol 2,3-dioxygenase-like lactoylglutathione lyase family enzyme